MFPFTGIQIALVSFGLFFLVFSLILFSRSRHQWAFFALVLSGFSLWSMAASLDSFLNPWDERFHALVARNMMDDMFKPVLYDQVYPGNDPLNWSKAHVWLHKQPLFLWQIAFSYMLFGVSEFTTRLPSVILLTLSLIAVYRIALLLFNHSVAYLSGFLMVSMFYLLSLVSGRQGMDHNDIAFFAYVTLSIWSWLAYTRKPSVWLAVLTGLLSGAAIMCKWLTGLAVYLPWALWIVFRKDKVRSVFHVLVALIMTILSFLPWMIHTLRTYPEVADYELEYHHRHFNEAIEGHEGPWYFHLENFPTLYGDILAWLIIPSIIIFILKSRIRIQSYGLLLLMIFVYAFFSMAKSKLPGYTLPVASIVFISVAVLLDYAIEIIRKKFSRMEGLVYVLLILLFLSNMSMLRFLKVHHPDSNGFSSVQVSNRETFVKLDRELPDHALLFNLPGRSCVDMMFYTDITAFGFLPDDDLLKEYLGYQRPIYILNPDSSAFIDLKKDFPDIQSVNAPIYLNE